MFSALVFAIFHQNFFQFFGTFASGLIFGYVYVRTGRLRYTILYHMIGNLISVAASFIFSLVDLEALNALDTTLPEQEFMEAASSVLPGVMLLLLYLALVVVLFISGLILFIIKRRKLTFKEAPLELPKGTRFKTVYLNVGVILFVFIFLALTILTLYL